MIFKSLKALFEGGLTKEDVINLYSNIDELRIRTERPLYASVSFGKTGGSFTDPGESIYRDAVNIIALELLEKARKCLDAQEEKAWGMKVDEGLTYTEIGQYYFDRHYSKYGKRLIERIAIKLLTEIEHLQN